MAVSLVAVSLVAKVSAHDPQMHTSLGWQAGNRPHTAADDDKTGAASMCIASGPPTTDSALIRLNTSNKSSIGTTTVLALTNSVTDIRLKSMDSRPPKRFLESLSPNADNADPIARMGTLREIGRNESIFSKGAAAKSVYKVETGCIRTFATLGNGRRADLAFYFPGDYFGLETRDRHSICAEAAVSSSVVAINRDALHALARADIAVARFLYDITERELQRMRDARLLLYLSASGRVAQFLVNQKRRSGGKVVELLMTRKDIADHLGLTIESVSRALTRLTAKAAISFESHRRVVVNIRKSLAA